MTIRATFELVPAGSAAALAEEVASSVEAVMDALASAPVGPG